MNLPLSRRINWTLLAVIVGCVAFLIIVGLQEASAISLRTARTARISRTQRALTVMDRIRWAARLGVSNRAISGLRILDGLNPAAMNDYDRDMWHLTKARLLVQVHDLNAAINEYNAIHKNSSLWIDAIEEKGEVTARQGKYAAALAILQTAFAPQFKNQVHPLTFFVASLTHLKICDFPGVFTVSQEFKQNIKTRLPDWRARAATGDLKARRMLAETKTTLHDLQIIEADVIQRMSLAEKAASGRTLGHITNSDDVLKFPVSNSPNPEVWSDELGHYAAQVKTCPAPHLLAQNQAKGARVERGSEGAQQ